MWNNGGTCFVVSNLNVTDAVEAGVSPARDLEFAAPKAFGAVTTEIVYPMIGREAIEG